MRSIENLQHVKWDITLDTAQKQKIGLIRIRYERWKQQSDRYEWNSRNPYPGPQPIRFRLLKMYDYYSKAENRSFTFVIPKGIKDFSLSSHYNEEKYNMSANEKVELINKKRLIKDSIIPIITVTDTSLDKSVTCYLNSGDINGGTTMEAIELLFLKEHEKLND